MNNWIIWAYLVVTLLILLQNFSYKKRIRKLEDNLFVLKKDEWLPFAKAQLHLPKIQAIKQIRQQYPELSLQQAMQLYLLAAGK